MKTKVKIGKFIAVLGVLISICGVLIAFFYNSGIGILVCVAALGVQLLSNYLENGKIKLTW